MPDGFASTDAAHWIDRAADRCGLQPRGLESLLPGLELFLDAYGRITTPTQAGRLETGELILATLSARFAIEEWLARNPVLLSRPVEKPVFILGMPRAGTTALVNLLAHDRTRRFYWSWEEQREVPPARAAHMRDDPRVTRKVAEVNAALEAGLLDHRQHVELGNQPAECIALMAQDFKSYLWLSRGIVPEYFNWLLDDADMTAAYRHHHRALQLMQSEAPGKWTLKLPNHAMAIDALLAVYPDARIIVSHRDPVKVVGSSCDAERFFIERCNHGIDLHALGRQTMQLLSTEMDRIRAVRCDRPEIPFYDFHFRRFANDPLAEIGRIYDFLGDPLKTETEAAMHAELRTHADVRHRVGAHRYDLATFGLSSQTVDDVFRNYIVDNGIEPEGG